MPTESGEARVITGTWQFTGTQVGSTHRLEGFLTVSSQRGQTITGTVTWQELDGIGVVRTDGGLIRGSVFGETDIDFDVELDSGDRRHVGRFSADTIEGVWVQPTAGLNGEFRLRRVAQ